MIQPIQSNFVVIIYLSSPEDITHDSDLDFDSFYRWFHFSVGKKMATAGYLKNKPKKTKPNAVIMCFG